MFGEKTLELLLQMDAATVARDLADAPSRVGAISAALAAYDSLPIPRRTPANTAQYVHNLLLAATVARSQPLSDHEADVVLFEVAHLLDDLAAAAPAVATRKPGRLRDLAQAMRAIARREGVSEVDLSERDTRPPDYEKLAAESDKLWSGIMDTTIEHLFRRYGFQDFADLFTADPMEFAVRREVGRRLSVPRRPDSPKTDALAAQRLQDHFGPRAVALLRSRLNRPAP